MAFASPTESEAAAALLGGRAVLKRDVHDPIDAHDLLLRGLPWQSLLHLLQTLSVLRQSDLLEGAIGMSMRTAQRKKAHGKQSLSREQSGRAWNFAKILAKATDVFGTQQAAEEWLDRPAIGLDQRRPIDLLTTPAGVELVEEYLERLEYGVYT
jgi:putative toxin-antitoxin system antitoxin component (TIGR02293 family)